MSNWADSQLGIVPVLVAIPGDVAKPLPQVGKRRCTYTVREEVASIESKLCTVSVRECSERFLVIGAVAFLSRRIIRTMA